MRAGRAFTDEEDRPGAVAQVAVISDRLWARAFDRSNRVFEQTVRVNGVPFNVVGVAGSGFHGTDRVSSVDLWLPGAASPVVSHQTIRYDDRAAGGFYEFITRIAPGATEAQVEAELASMAAWLTEQHPDVNAKFKQTKFHLFGAIGFGAMPASADRMRSLLALMLAVSALILLIVGANVASLLLIKGVGRRSEVAVRKALGASRARLIRQHVTEGTLLWSLGGVAGAGVVWTMSRAVDVAPMLGLRVPDAHVPIDWRVLTFAAGLSLCVGVVFSLLPATRAVRAEAAATLRDTTPSATRRLGVGAALSVAQLAAALTLFVGALLLTASLRHLVTIPLGFEPSSVTTFRVDPARLGYSEPEVYTY